MSDVNATPANTVGYININISEHDMTYDTQFSIPEVIFWLDVVKSMILNRIQESVNE